MSDARRALIVRRTDACRTHEPKRTHTNDLPRATYDFFCVRLRTTIVQHVYAKISTYDNSVIRTTQCRTYDGRVVRLSYDMNARRTQAVRKSGIWFVRTTCVRFTSDVRPTRVRLYYVRTILVRLTYATADYDFSC